MINFEGILLFLGGFSILALGVYVGHRLINKLLSQGVYSIDNANELLKLSKPDEWNALRLLNSSWKPTIQSEKFTNLNLSGVDFQNTKLSNIDFSNSILDDANFAFANLDKVNFSHVSLRNANFEKAILKNINLEDAVFDEDTFNTAIIENLSEHIVESNKPSTKVDIPIEELGYQIIKNPDLLKQISPRQFEELVAYIFRRSGYETKITAAPGDKGIDIIAFKQDPLVETTSIIQCKHYSREHPVSSSYVYAFYGVKQLENADRAIFVTSSKFSNEAKEIAKRFTDLELIDREQLMIWMKKVFL